MIYMVNRNSIAWFQIIIKPLNNSVAVRSPSIYTHGSVYVFIWLFSPTYIRFTRLESCLLLVHKCLKAKSNPPPQPCTVTSRPECFWMRIYTIKPTFHSYPTLKTHTIFMFGRECYLQLDMNPEVSCSKVRILIKESWWPRFHLHLFYGKWGQGHGETWPWRATRS